MKNIIMITKPRVQFLISPIILHKKNMTLLLELCMMFKFYISLAKWPPQINAYKKNMEC